MFCATRVGPCEYLIGLQENAHNHQFISPKKQEHELLSMLNSMVVTGALYKRNAGSQIAAVDDPIR